MSGAKRILAALVAAAVLLMGTAALAEDTKINISAGEAGAVIQALQARSLRLIMMKQCWNLSM